MIYRIHADALLRLATYASAAPGADLDAILAILRGADVEPEEPAEMPDVSDGPVLGAEKPAKPE